MKLDELVKDAGTIGISGHVRPDGDCVGSCLAAYLYLRRNYPSARTDVFLEPIPKEFDFLSGSDRIRTDFVSDVARYDVFIALDSEKERLGGAEAHFDRALKTVNIDHHISNPGSGDVNYIRPDASSASEVLYGLLAPEKTDVEIAKALYTGIVCDTGVFKYSSVSPATMQIGGALIAYGFDHTALIDHVFFEKTYTQNRILGKALADSRLLLDGRCVASVLRLETMRAFAADGRDLEGIVSQMKLTIGAECAFFLHELEEGVYKVSLRSGSAVDVSRITKRHGGGGHIRAAGCTIRGDSDEIVRMLTDEIAAELSRTDGAS